MGIKRALLCAALILFAGFAFALDADELVQSAMDNSTTIRTLQLNRENALLSRQADDVEDEIAVTVSSGDVTVQKETTVNPAFNMSPYVTVEIPSGDNSTVTLGLSNVSRLYRNGDNSMTFTPSADYRKTITLENYTDNRKDLTKQMNNARSDLSYQTSILQFRNGVINSMIGIIQAKVNLAGLETTYTRSLSDYNSDILTGKITPDSLKDLSRKMAVETAKINLESQQTRLDNLLENFKKNYGIDYKDIDAVRAADLTLEAVEGGNTTVYLNSISLQIANQALAAATGTARNIVINGNANTPMTVTNGDNLTTAINASFGATISASNYSVGAKAGASYRSDELFPYLTITGTWTNKTKQKADDLTIQTLRNNVILAQIEYDNSLEAYRSDILSLQGEIDDLNISFAQFAVSSSYNNQFLERAQEMYSFGLVTERDVQDAAAAVYKDRVQSVIFGLQALVIENKIAIIQL